MVIRLSEKGMTWNDWPENDIWKKLSYSQSYLLFWRRRGRQRRPFCPCFSSNILSSSQLLVLFLPLKQLFCCACCCLELIFAVWKLRHLQHDNNTKDRFTGALFGYHLLWFLNAWLLTFLCLGLIISLNGLEWERVSRRAMTCLFHRRDWCMFLLPTTYNLPPSLPPSLLLTPIFTDRSR